ncbi:MAG: aminopeptidase N [Gammaproteobacteria bacterium]|nr:aminopeptidase N [Gammaproteobacteria bacterium]
MKDASASTTPQTIYLKDYSVPGFLIDSVHLTFVLDEASTRVQSRLVIRRNPDSSETDQGLRLDGQELELISVAIDGRLLDGKEYTLGEENMEIAEVPDAFVLEIETRIQPQNNTSLEGLYKSSGNFCTQCEAEGFRKITYYPDRPDVMSVFTTRIEADKGKYPVLLSNGNLVESGELEDGRHYAVWLDPHKKPSYLFALVAGHLEHIEDRYTTLSGREVVLRIYTEQHNIDKCDHAMRSLKRSMQWDEEVYGREYDLDIYHIVAVDDFNMGAMENKGLNVFNTKFVLAKQETATDNDFINVEAVIGHEYFHNWSGNRVTCRDWFQLSLKEGFTVFRDQSFTADMTSHAVKRIDDVNLLRNHQFPEDAGPLAHPVRPESYVEINNFYTATVYEKGAEVVRMLYNFLGAEGFRRGTDLYFERHDGQAVTTDDFVRAMEDASGRDFSQFRLWYSQAGTPRVEVSDEYDASSRRYSLHVKQSRPAINDQDLSQAMHIPLAMGLMREDGTVMEPKLDSGPQAQDGTVVLELTEHEQSFHFVDVDSRPIPSLLRGFSAPVILNYDYSRADLAFLMAHDADPFNRWEAGQQLMCQVILRAMQDYRHDRPMTLDDSLLEAVAKTLREPSDDWALEARVLGLPSENYLAERCEEVDPEAIHQARRFIKRELARRLRSDWINRYQSSRVQGDYGLGAEEMGQRSLTNVALSYLMELEEPAVAQMCALQYEEADNMTDQLAALTALVNTESSQKERFLGMFYDRWQDEALVVDKWFSVQATSQADDTLDRVTQLRSHPAFTLKNPNRMRSLIGAFCMNNPRHFHSVDGRGYALLAETVLALNDMNPQIAARLLKSVGQWRKLEPARRELMKTQLQRIKDKEGLSKDVYEVVSKSLGQEEA